MATLPQFLTNLWGRKRALALAMEYRQTFAGRHMVLCDLAKRCDVGASAPATATECVKQAARQEVFGHIARMLELKPEDFISIVDGRNIE